MRTSPSPHQAGGRAHERGFTLVELLITIAITTIVLGGALTALRDATRAAETATMVSNLNATMRTSMDLIVRDLLQVGQGLPAGRVIQIPSGANSTPIRLPGPPNSTLTLPGATELTAFTPGPGLGPMLNGVSTDILITLQADSAFDQVRLAALPAHGQGMVVDPVVKISDGGPDDLHVGDLIMLSKGSLSTLAQVTAVNGQSVQMDAGDSLNLNQPTAEQGSVKWLREQAPVDYGALGVSSTATRIRMISYYVDTITDPRRPRLVRRINNGHPTSFDNTLGTVVAFDVESLQFTYDLADGVTNPSNVRMTAADLAGTGACAPNPCSPNQIRKINVLMRARSPRPLTATGQFFRKDLVTQVSVRSLAFVDRYR